MREKNDNVVVVLFWVIAVVFAGLAVHVFFGVPWTKSCFGLGCIYAAGKCFLISWNAQEER